MNLPVVSDIDFTLPTIDIVQEIKNRGIQFVSFDVFDTVLWRRPRAELARFDAAARIARQNCHSRALLTSSLTHTDFFHARVFAHRKAYHSLGVRKQAEANFDEVCLGMATYLGLRPSEVIPVLREAEFTVERSDLSLNPVIAQCIDALSLAGVRVVFLSDMYLRGDDIRDLILHCAPDWSTLAVHSSADINHTKHRGSAFPWMFQYYTVSPNQVLHVGDNPISDVQNARKAGCLTAWTPRSAQWSARKKASERRWSLRVSY